MTPNTDQSYCAKFIYLELPILKVPNLFDWKIIVSIFMVDEHVLYLQWDFFTIFRAMFLFQVVTLVGV